MAYVGRFAPSPSGALHLGSLTTAVASYLHARQAGGEWLVRIDDIDPPREVAGAADEILRALEALELHWDRSVIYQSRRMERYRAVADDLLETGLAFRCSCSRKQLGGKLTPAGAYPGLCRSKHFHEGPTALRLRVDEPAEDGFVDGLQGFLRGNVRASLGDYVIFRRDGLPAYHLATVIDDADLGITDVVRGCDLLESTWAHRHLLKTLELSAPQYWHLPVLVNAAGQKLSKQTGARAIDTRRPGELSSTVLRLLGLSLPAGLQYVTPSELWAWARNHWRIESLKGPNSIEV